MPQKSSQKIKKKVLAAYFLWATRGLMLGKQNCRKCSRTRDASLQIKFQGDQCERAPEVLNLCQLQTNPIKVSKMNLWNVR